MLAIITISGSTGMVLHFAYGVPWFSAGAVPTHVVFLLGVGLPLIFAIVAYLIKKEKITQYESFNEDSYTQQLKSQLGGNKDTIRQPKVSSFDSEASFRSIPYLPEVRKHHKTIPTGPQ